ncbi:hypothetical protein ACTHHL_04555 [Aeribacillus composti]
MAVLWLLSMIFAGAITVFEYVNGDVRKLVCLPRNYEGGGLIGA